MITSSSIIHAFNNGCTEEGLCLGTMAKYFLSGRPAQHILAWVANGILRTVWCLNCEVFPIILMIVHQVT